LTVADGNEKVGVAEIVGEGVMVGVRVSVGVKVMVGVGVNVNVGVGVFVHAAAVAVMDVAVIAVCSSGDGPQEVSANRVDTINQTLFI
jgi:hypothetical protein